MPPCERAGMGPPGRAVVRSTGAQRGHGLRADPLGEAPVPGVTLCSRRRKGAAAVVVKDSQTKLQDRSEVDPVCSDPVLFKVL